MSSPSTPPPPTPPDAFSADEVTIAIDFSALDILTDPSAVGGKVSEERRSETISTDSELAKFSGIKRRDEALDPLLFAAAVASGPHVTRNHYHHSLFPGAEDSDAPLWDWYEGLTYASKQAPRSARLGRKALLERDDPSRSPSPGDDRDDLQLSLELSPLSISRSSSYSSSETSSLSPRSSASSDLFGAESDSDIVATPTVSRVPAKTNEVQVKCMVRTRVPTPHGEVFLHLYQNDRDDKEHLAIVIDPAQLDAVATKAHAAPFIRSQSLDAVWHDYETPMERVTRGAYVGRLSETGYQVSTPEDAVVRVTSAAAVPAPLVRIHSECFTGETIGSMRCDCGEQLDEALRRIAEPITFADPSTGAPLTIPGRGAVIYMRQEGRGIGLLSKLRAYNLQDLGHDTVQANLLLGHKADERGYEVAAAILRDLGLGGGEGIRLLTNNPDKVEKLTDEGVQVAERVSMVPRTWRCQPDGASATDIHGATHDQADEETAARLRSAGATLIGAGATHGPELEKYLRTKVLRMGHMLSLPPSELSLGAH